jgi:hypothetical protein
MYEKNKQVLNNSPLTPRNISFVRTLFRRVTVFSVWWCNMGYVVEHEKHREVRNHSPLVPKKVSSVGTLFRRVSVSIERVPVSSMGVLCRAL